MRKLALLVFLSCASAHAQELKFASLGDFTLESGESIRDCRIGYRTYGHRTGNNVIVLFTWLAGTTQSLEQSIGPGKLFDSSHFYIVSIDALGDGVSSSPSNSKLHPDEHFPRFTIQDMVRSQHELLARTLQLDHVFAVAGLSMGGIQVLQWIVTYPDFMDRAVAITGTPKQTAHDLVLWKTQLAMIEKDPQHAIPLIAGMNSMHLSTPARVNAQTPPEKTDVWMQARASELAHLHPLDYASQLRAMIGHDIYRGSPPEEVAKSVRAKLLVIVSLQDLMVNPAPARELARLAKADLVTLTGDCGHVAPACEQDVVAREVHRFLAQQ